MDNTLKIALVQPQLDWENPASNRAGFDRLLQNIEVDLIVLPEMFTSGFTMHPQRVSETMDGESVQWMKSRARELDSVICGSLVIEEQGQFYNRLLFVRPNGIIDFYNKRHLFALAGEDSAYSTKGERLVVDFRGWRICPLICYDLRFPVYSRNDQDYDLLIYVANWPESRISAWDTLLSARAIENMSYVAAVNRVGTDANGHRYPGHSQLVDFMGKVQAKMDSREEVLILEIDKSSMLKARSGFGFLHDRDSFTVT